MRLDPGSEALPRLAGADTEGVSIDFHQILMTIWDGKALLLLVAGLVISAGLFHLFVELPVYKAEATLQIERPASVPGLEAFNALFTTETQVSAETHVLKSRDLARNVVERLGLDVQVTPRYFPLIGQAIARRRSADKTPTVLAAAGRGVHFVMDHYAWGRESITISRYSIPTAWYGASLMLRATKGGFELWRDEEQVLAGQVGKAVEAQTRAGAVSVLISELHAKPGTEFYIKRLNATDVAESLRHRVKAETPDRFSTGLIMVTLEDTSAERTRNILSALVDAYMRRNVDNRSAQAAQMIEFIERQLPGVKSDVQAAELALQKFRQEKGAVDLQAGSRTALEKLLKLEAEIASVALQRSELLLEATDRHPAVIALDTRRQVLAQAKAEAERDVNALPQQELELLRLTRDLEGSSEIYSALANRAQELKIAKAGEIGNVRVINSPIVPKSPVRPRPFLVVILSIALGVLLGLAVIALRELLRRGLRDQREVERRLGLPVYASIAYSEGERKLSVAPKGATPESRLLVSSQPNDAAVESLRSLRTALHFAQFDARNNIIVITGSVPDVGKSFVTSNLAALLASAGRRTLLIDADLRWPRIHQIIQCDRKPGLSEVLSSGARLDEAMQKIDENLHVIAAGTSPPNPSELLLSARLDEMLNMISDRFDYVLMDCPPVLSVSDAAIVAKRAGSSFLVMRYGRHPATEMEEAIKRLRQGGAEVRGIIMNAVTHQEERYASYRYGYGYYGYKNRYQ